MSRLEAPCPSCSKEIIIRPKGFFCSGCEFKIWSEVSGKKLTQNQVETLIKKVKPERLKALPVIKPGKSLTLQLFCRIKLRVNLGFSSVKNKD